MTFDPGIDTEPSWSADGRKLYFTSDRAGSPQIYEIDVAQPGTRHARDLRRAATMRARACRRTASSWRWCS